MARRRGAKPIESIARIRDAARKSALARERELRTEADDIADGVRAVAIEIERVAPAGALYWQAPIQYVVEQMAPRVCAAHGLPDARSDDVAAYLLAGMNEYVVALVGSFDREHFETWTAAAVHRERAGEGASG